MITYYTYLHKYKIFLQISCQFHEISNLITLVKHFILIEILKNIKKYFRIL